MKRKSFLLVVMLSISLLLLFYVSYSKREKEVVIVPDAIEEVQTYGDDLYHELFDETLFRQVRIEMTQASFDGLSSDMLRYASVDDRMRVGSYQTANISILIGEDWVHLDQVGIRTKGNTTRILPEDDGELNKFHFKVKFNETFDLEEDDELAVKLDNRELAGLKELNFKFNFWSDYTYVREHVAYDMLREAGVLTSNTAMSQVVFVVDGVERNYGIYLMVEPIDKSFITRHVGKEQNDGDLYKCLWQNHGPATLEPITDPQAIGIKDWEANYRPAYDLKTNKETNNHDKLNHFIDNLNRLEGEEFVTFIESSFDVDMFLRYQAMAVLIGMPDDYWAMGNNYYLYFDETGFCRFIPYDYDHSMGGGWDAQPWGYEGIANSDILKWYNLNQAFMGTSYKHPLVEKILAVDVYRETYIDYVDYYLNSEDHLFGFDKYKETADLFRSLYDHVIANDIYPDEQFQWDNETWYFNERTESVNSQLDKLREE